MEEPRHIDSEIAQLRTILADATSRLEQLEARRELETRHRPAPAPPPRYSVPPLRTERAQVPPRPPKPEPKPRRSLEELLSPRVLAMTGGVVTFLGVAFFVALGISRGWIGPEARVIAAALLSIALAGGGIHLHRRGEESLGSILVATAIAGGYATLLGATVLYGFLPDAAGLAGALAVAAAGTALGLRWGDQPVVGFALIGALVAPVLIDAPSESVTAAYLVASLGGACAITSVKRWWVLAGVAASFALPQLAALALYDKAPGLVALVLAWAEVTAATMVPVLISRVKDWQPPVWLWALASSVIALAGYAALYEDGSSWDAVWVFSFAAAHLLVAFGARVRRPENEALQAFALLAGSGLAALGAALVLDGPALVVAWAGKAVLLTLPREGARPWRIPWDRLAAIVLFGMAAIHTLAIEAPLDSLWQGLPDDLDAALALGTLALAAGAATWWTPVAWRPVPGLTAITVLAYAIPLFSEGAESVALWSLLAIAACLLARPLETDALAIGAWAVFGLAAGDTIAEVAALRQADGDRDIWQLLAATGSLSAAALALAALREGGERTGALIAAFAAPAYASLLVHDGVWETVALCALAVAAAHLPWTSAPRRALIAAALLATTVLQTLIVNAPPAGLASGTDPLGAALASLMVVALAAGACALVFRGLGVSTGGRQISLSSAGSWMAGTSLAYAGSLAVVELVGGQASSIGLSGIDQPAQVALSAYWAVVGVAAVVAGLRAGRPSLRFAGLGLMGLALAKIFILDLNSLDASYRAVSFIAVGLLLLAASLAYRRLSRGDRERTALRPIELADEPEGWIAPCLAVVVAGLLALAISGADLADRAASSTTAANQR